nr:MAG TPA: transcription factor [Caudoviricetes sp.]
MSEWEKDRRPISPPPRVKLQGCGQGSRQGRRLKNERIYRP